MNAVVRILPIPLVNDELPLQRLLQLICREVRSMPPVTFHAEIGYDRFPGFRQWSDFNLVADGCRIASVILA